MLLIKLVTPAEAGKFIHRELRAAERIGFSGKAALAQVVRPGNIAASFSGSMPTAIAISGAAEVRSANLADLIGIKRVAIPAGEFIYQGQKIEGNGFKIAETEFTNGQFRQLLALRPTELSQIVANPQERLKGSMGIAADQNAADDCPMVYLSQVESEGIARLLGLRLLTDQEWERAAAGTNGRMYSFGEDFDESKVTFNDQGTRSVYAHRDAATSEGVLDLSGNVWEWTSSNYTQESNTRVLRGGSWSNGYPGCLRASDRGNFHPESRHSTVGVRFAEDL